MPMTIDVNYKKKKRYNTAHYPIRQPKALTYLIWLLSRCALIGKKWKVENSWGSDSGQNGYIIMTGEWFREYMFRVVVNRKYCPASVLETLKQKPVRLPAWDPMFSEED